MRQRGIGFHQESWRRLYVNKKRREGQRHRQRGGSGLDHTEEPDVCSYLWNVEEYHRRYWRLGSMILIHSVMLRQAPRFRRSAVVR